MAVKLRSSYAINTNVQTFHYVQQVCLYVMSNWGQISFSYSYNSGQQWRYNKDKESCSLLIWPRWWKSPSWSSFQYIWWEPFIYCLQLDLDFKQHSVVACCLFLAWVEKGKMWGNLGCRVRWQLHVRWVIFNVLYGLKLSSSSEDQSKLF